MRALNKLLALAAVLALGLAGRMLPVGDAGPAPAALATSQAAAASSHHAHPAMSAPVGAGPDTAAERAAREVP